jgi:methylglutaconyl-CoA hydratase
MSDVPVTLTTDARGVATLTLNRPDVHNAFDDALIAELDRLLAQLTDDRAVRVVVLAAAGRSFSAGADLHWMRRMAAFDEQQNVDDALRLARLLRRLDRLPKPTVARVQGAALGGGVGLVACCDVAVAARGAVFALSEVRLGLIPATISPYLVAAIGARAARRYVLTGERFGAEEALRIGLVHEVAGDDDLDAAAERIVAALLQGGPGSIAAGKELVAYVAASANDQALLAESARRIARARARDEGREGIAAFLEKRKPRWIR